MAPKTVLITGCSSGIGLALAVRLARDKQRRFRVIATMRNVGRSGALAAAAGSALGRTLEIKQLDVCDEGSIRACLDGIPGRHVDVLVSNAGVGMVGPLECQSLAAMQSLMDTNFFGLVRLVKEVLPDMKRRRGGHIVVISSIMGLQGIVFNDIYAASKFAVEGFCESLVVQALRFNVAISLVEPGPVTTEFEAKLYEEAERTDYSRTDPETADIFTNLYLRNSKDVFASLGQTPEDIAEVTGRWVALPGRGLPSSHPPGWAGLSREASISPNEVQRPPAGSGAGSPPRQLLPPELHPDGAEPSWELGWMGIGMEWEWEWGWDGDGM
uniref:Ketoreductase domain-containing protein n=1 Tax=Accipiter nisus TaxID=211598 RepID=A0A8B9NMG0_9AVES